ncbi:MAG: BON domain-containing protein [Rudaea sp.]
MKTDAQLQDDVMAELRWEPSVEATAIGVEVTGGIVTLAGHVDSYTQRWAAEKAAQRVSGVRGLAIEIDVALSSSNTRSDTEIAQAARHALDWNSSLPKDAINLVVRDGSITLSGVVGWAYQRDAAVASVRHLVGVVDIVNELKVMPKVETRDLKKKITAALHRHAQIDAQKISVDVDGCEVTLSGNVDSWAEKTAARDAAWAAPGVWTVVDHMKVGG